jgi:signal transduction histidine kinase
MHAIRNLFNQLGPRLILGALVFLVALSGAIILVVRDSLQLLARDLEGLIAQGVIKVNVNDILQATVLTIGYFAVIAIIGVIFAARALTNPIQTLVEGTRAIAAGKLDTRIAVKSKDELGVLAESFNQMADSLQRQTQELTEANQAAIENARLYEQAHAIATMEERQRLARELHDSVTQSLYSLTLLAEASKRTASSGDIDKAVGNISRLGETAQQALKEMRLLVYELRPLALEQAGLSDALQNRLDAVEKRAGVDAQLRVSLEADLHPTIENGLFRIAQEVLNNSLKHAEATKILVSLTTHEGHVELEIQDNGKGFESEAIQDQGGLGMVSIRERVEALHGWYSITSKPGAGVRVWIRVPMNQSV